MLQACGGQSQRPQPIVLVNQTGTGNASSILVSADKSGWDLQWSYDCSTTGGRGVFVVDVFNSDRTPDFIAPGVNEQGDADSGVYHVAQAGRFYLDVTTTCRWTVKVVETP